MTTSAEIWKFAKRGFTGEMARRGFSATRRRLCYWRKVNDIYHVCFLCLTRGNEEFYVHFCAWVPELAPQPYDWAKFPDDVFMVTGGILGERGPAQGASEYREWKVGTERENLEALKEALALIDRAAIPWFERISTREELARHVRRDSETDRFGNRTVDKIFGRNLLYKDKLPPPVGAKA
jgi:hypothetical protein